MAAFVKGYQACVRSCDESSQEYPSRSCNTPLLRNVPWITYGFLLQTKLHGLIGEFWISQILRPESSQLNSPI